MPLAIVIGMAIRFFTTSVISLLPEITSVYMFTILKHEGSGVHHPLQLLSHYMHVVSQEHGFCSAMYDFGHESIYLPLLGHFDSLFQII